MAMVRTNYSKEMSGEDTARAMATELDISPKHAIEIAAFLRRKNTDDAIAYLAQVRDLQKAIPFRRFKRNVAHKRGLPTVASGRYPVKAAKEYIRLLESVKKNAEYIGLDTGALKIVHITANRGRRTTGFFPRAMGRATPKRRETVNLEVIVREVS
jgi:large subunit ribosomal protein L22